MRAPQSVESSVKAPQSKERSMRAPQSEERSMKAPFQGEVYDDILKYVVLSLVCHIQPDLKPRSRVTIPASFTLRGHVMTDNRSPEKQARNFR